MTSAERHAYLIKLAVEAIRPYVSSVEPGEEIVRRISERMAQAAQTWTCEVDEAGERFDRWKK